MVYFLIKTLCQYLLRWLSARWTFRQDNRILVWHPLQHGGACSFNLSYSLSAADPCAPSDHGHALAVPFQIVAPFILCPKEQNFQAWRDFPLCIWGWSVSRCVLHESTNSSPFPLQNLLLVHQRVPFCDLEQQLCGLFLGCLLFPTEPHL